MSTIRSKDYPRTSQKSKSKAKKYQDNKAKLAGDGKQHGPRAFDRSLNRQVDQKVVRKNGWSDGADQDQLAQYDADDELNLDYQGYGTRTGFEWSLQDGMGEIFNDYFQQSIDKSEESRKRLTLADFPTF
jgi:hypothetical protein